MDYRQQTTLPRGIRNNNPGNIKADGTAWQGAAGDDGTFIIFVDDTWGLRAMALDLTNKINRGLNTITEIITEYEGGTADTDNNNIAAYISAVSNYTGLDADEQLVADQQTLHTLIRAIANQESGAGPSQQYITDADIDTGISMVSGSVAQYLQAGAIAAENNPTNMAIVAILAASALWMLFK